MPVRRSSARPATKFELRLPSAPSPRPTFGPAVRRLLYATSDAFLDRSVISTLIVLAIVSVAGASTSLFQAFPSQAGLALDTVTAILAP